MPDGARWNPAMQAWWGLPGSHPGAPRRRETGILGGDGDAVRDQQWHVLRMRRTDEERMATRVEQEGRTQPTMARQVSLPTRARRIGTWLGALGVLALCLGLHVYRLGQTPGWDPQEGYNLDLAWNLLHGRLRLFAMTQAFAQHPPLFYLQLALSIRLFGYGIVAVRALAGLY